MADNTYKKDRDEVIGIVGALVIPTMKAMDRAWEEYAEQSVVKRDGLEPQRVFCSGFAQGMEYQKEVAKGRRGSNG